MIEGYLFEQNSAANQKAVLVLFDEKYSINIDNHPIYKGEVSKLKISTRIGNTKRNIILEDGRVFSTIQNDLVDELLLTNKKSSFIHKLESNILLIFTSLIITIIFAFGVYKWGIPYASKKIAYALPIEATKVISKSSLEFLDKYLLSKTKISKEKQEKITKHFEINILPLIEDKKQFNYEIIFRNWQIEDESIANALALPDGKIVITDELIKLSTNQKELDSIILHEVGHIYNRHTLQRVSQNTFSALISMYITGDLSTFAQAGVGFASMAAYSKYSRDHEKEADLYSFKKMIQGKIDPIHFATIMSKITKNEHKQKEVQYDFLSSHPNTKSRVQKAKDYSKCFNKNIPCKDIK